MKEAVKREEPLLQPEGPPVLTGEDVAAFEERRRRREKKERAVLEAETDIFKSVPFLLLFSFTIMNAFLYVYLSVHDFKAIDQRSADMLIRDAFGKDYTYFSPIYEFLGETKTADELSFPDFKRSLTDLNHNIVSLGIPARRNFSREAFRFSKGGIYWAPPMIEGKTQYKPTI